MAYVKKKRKAKPAGPKRDVAQEITDQIVERLETGVKPWKKPWQGVALGPARRHNGEPYRGINSLILSMAAMQEGRTSPFFMTFKQAKDLGGQVRKGEKSLPVVYFSTFEKEEEKSNGETDTRKIFFMKHYNVFNAEQIEGLPDRYYPKPPTNEDILAMREAQHDPQVMKALEEMTVGLKLKGGYKEEGQQAFYRRDQDSITMPLRSTFYSFSEYAGTRTHEMAHATEAKDRLDMDWGGAKAFGNTAYAKGELYAEMTACFAAAEMGFVADNIDNSAAYLDSWLKTMKQDKNAIFKMASAAQKGTDYLLEMTSEYNKEKRAERYEFDTLETDCTAHKPVASNAVQDIEITTMPASFDAEAIDLNQDIQITVENRPPKRFQPKQISNEAR